jgi:hypothetical protein
MAEGKAENATWKRGAEAEMRDGKLVAAGVLGVPVPWYDTHHTVNRLLRFFLLFL